MKFTQCKGPSLHKACLPMPSHSSTCSWRWQVHLGLQCPDGIHNNSIFSKANNNVRPENHRKPSNKGKCLALGVTRYSGLLHLCFPNTFMLIISNIYHDNSSRSNWDVNKSRWHRNCDPNECHLTFGTWNDNFGIPPNLALIVFKKWAVDKAMFIELVILVVQLIAHAQFLKKNYKGYFFEN